ncbi:MAG: Na+/H+ antiporter subunit E [Sphingobium sp.]|nr:Na+/H+ antiporter subunit E [Sphingobium sp.]
MKRFVPFPLLSLALFVMWVLLTGFSPGHVVLGAAVALLVSRVMLLLKPEPATIRFCPAMLKLSWLVLVDIIRSNIAVARIILFRPKNRRSDFIYLPVQLTSPYALAVLGIIITATPGTLWVQHDPQSKVILIHVLDLVDQDAWITLIQNRYEKLLMEIFE